MCEPENSREAECTVKVPRAVAAKTGYKNDANRVGVGLLRAGQRGVGHVGVSSLAPSDLAALATLVASRAASWAGRGGTDSAGASELVASGRWRHARCSPGLVSSLALGAGGRYAVVSACGVRAGLEPVGHSHPGGLRRPHRSASPTGGSAVAGRAPGAAPSLATRGV